MEKEKEFEFYLKKYLEESRHGFYHKEKAEKRFQEQFKKELEEDFVNYIENIIGPVRGKRILEVGSGTGWRCVAMALAGAEVSGVEPLESGVMASILRGKKYPDLSLDLKVGVAEKLPFPDNFFDAVISFQVIEHVQDIKLSLSETHRVLKSGGVVYMETPNSSFPREEHYRIFWIPYMPKFLGRIYARLWGKNPVHLDHVNFIHRGPIIKDMKRAGFTEVRECFKDHVLEKFSNPETINNRFFKKLVLPFSGSKSILTFLGKIAVSLSLYPALYLYGKK